VNRRNLFKSLAAICAAPLVKWLPGKEPQVVAEPVLRIWHHDGKVIYLATKGGTYQCLNDGTFHETGWGPNPSELKWPYALNLPHA
jgi:hypothetical protein